MVPHPPLIVPDVGRGQEKGISSTVDAFKKAADFIVSLEPETVIVISPHSAMYSDYFHISPGSSASGNFGQFRARNVGIKAEYDKAFAEALGSRAGLAGLPAGSLGERDRNLDHGTMIPLYFIREALAGRKLPKIVRIGLSGLPLTEHYRLGMLIKETAELPDRSVAVIASGDLSHKLTHDGPYGFSPEGPLYDERIMDVMGRGAFGELFGFPESFCEKAAECGHRSFVVMAGCFDGVSVHAQRLSHEGPFGVGYGVCTFLPGAADESRRFLDIRREALRREAAARIASEDPYVALARASFTAWTENRERIPVPEGLPPEMYKRRAGVFVSLHLDGALRGCIGTISPAADCIAEEIIENAIAACSRDNRFTPVRQEELNQIECSVDVLGEAEPVSSIDELDAARYGVIVTSGRRRGLLLPALDGVDTPQQQISIAKRKAGIPEGETVALQRFEVVRHH